LPSEGWLNRIGSGAPNGPLEAFFEIVRRQVYARSSDTENAYSLEAEIHPPLDGLIEAARTANKALQKLAAPLNALIKALTALLDDEAKTLAEERRRKLEAVSRSLRQRAALTVTAWQQMLQAIGGETPPIFVDWLHIERIEGRDYDIGFSRHYIDPTQPLADVLTGQAHGIVITSATLTDDTGDTELDWAAAEMQTGTRHLPKPAMRAQMNSPFDYKEATRIYIVRDVKKGDLDHVAAAYRELFLAAGGGALGLFTAIQRLRGVYDRIAAPLEAAGIDLYAQHVDGLNPATLVDIFRAEEHSCLLGTDAIRDGVDVPGRALRMIVFDRVPWSRPNLLYKARREAFGGGAYEDRLTRLRLKQAFGRLIRREGDRGVFVLLDGMLPSRLTTAFPPGVEIVRTGLAEAIRGSREFLAD
jgi:ATP-dependent DNA helicase DinG